MVNILLFPFRLLYALLRKCVRSIRSMTLDVWLVWRYMTGRAGQFFNFSTVLAIIGMALGVGTLVLVMAVFSGFEASLRNAIVDITGHLYLSRRGGVLDPMEELGQKVRKLVPSVKSMTPYVLIEGMVPFKGKIAGVLFEGHEPDTVNETLKLKDRIIEGRFDLGTGKEKMPNIIVGKGLAADLGIGVGDVLPVVVPTRSPTSRVVGLQPRLKRFKVVGLIDLGMYKYNKRYLLAAAPAVQKLGALKGRYQGVRIKLDDYRKSRDASDILSTELGYKYYSRDWFDQKRNLFQAVALERKAIFVILLFLTIAACFNIASTLFISVVRRYGDISVLKTLGATRGRLVRFFSVQGMFIGIIGSIAGVFVGWLGIGFLTKTSLFRVPDKVYDLSRWPVELGLQDVVITLVVSFLLCFLSTLIPAIRGSRFNPIEGLRYE